MSLPFTVSLFGDASSERVAITACAVVLIAGLRYMSRSMSSKERRFLGYYTLAGILIIFSLGVAPAVLSKKGFTPDGVKQGTNLPRISPGMTSRNTPSTDKPSIADEYLGDPPNYSRENARPPPLKSPSARSGVTDQSNGS